MLMALGQSGVCFAEEVPLDWFPHTMGQVSVYAELVAGEESTLLMDGLLRFVRPLGFQVQYFTLHGPLIITSQDGFVEVQTQADIQYGYDHFWLFDDFQHYLFQLTEFSKMPMEFVGMDQLAGRSVKRYKARTNPNLTLWFDEESGLPFLIRQGKESVVKVASYLVATEEPKEMISLELKLMLGAEPARVTLEHTEAGWVPSRLVVVETQGQVEMGFSHWSLEPDWVNNPLPKLARLRELNECFLEAFGTNDWKTALAISQELIALAPQFWQAYLYQAFTYESLDNFLGVVENYQQVLMREPNHHVALNNLAYHYFLREIQIPQALDMAERAVALERKDIYLDTLGYGYYLVGRFEEAEALLLEALQTVQDEAAKEVEGHLELVRKAMGKGE